MACRCLATPPVSVITTLAALSWCDGAGSYGIVEQRQGVDEQVVGSKLSGLWDICIVQVYICTYMYSDSDMLALPWPISRRTLESSARSARELLSILLSLSVLGDFTRNNFAAPLHIQLAFYNRHGA